MQLARLLPNQVLRAYWVRPHEIGREWKMTSLIRSNSKKSVQFFPPPTFTEPASVFQSIIPTHLSFSFKYLKSPEIKEGDKYRSIF